MTEYTDGITVNGTIRMGHIVDRFQNDIPAATDLRTYLELGRDDWKEWVPRVNHEIAIDKFPKEYIIG